MLANKYAGQNPTDYFISEKLDGYRSIYDSETDTFWSRTNKQFFAPKFFTEAFPKEYQGHPLIMDGELYMGRGNFDKAGIFRKKNPIDSEWEEAMYYVFDLPMINAPFEERYNIMKELLSDIPYIHVVEQTRITSDKQMNDIHKNIVKINGEGSMLRLSGSYYENKRSKTLLKLKDFQDAEVKVIGYELGEGRNKGLLGALNVKWKNGPDSVEFKVGSGFDDYQRANYKTLFPIGSIITIKYFEIGPSNKPRFPSFWRVYKE
jgi:DNA ligase-1